MLWRKLSCWPPAKRYESSGDFRRNRDAWKLLDAGIPTVNPQVVISVDGTPGMLMGCFAQGSKDVVR